MTKLHKTLAYATILLSQVTVSLGVMNYLTYDGESDTGWILISSSNVLFFAVLISSEVIYRKNAKIEVRYAPEREELEHISRSDFQERIRQNGEKLVILDEYVLEIGDFISKHPGGRFVIEHNVGRDISKFFYGGYSLDGNVEF